MAVTVEFPLGRVVVIRLALPSAPTGDVPIALPPSKKVTVPVVTGVPPVWTFAVRVTGTLGWLDADEVESTVAVENGETVWVNARLFEPVKPLAAL